MDTGAIKGLTGDSVCGLNIYIYIHIKAPTKLLIQDARPLGLPGNIDCNSYGVSTK